MSLAGELSRTGQPLRPRVVDAALLWFAGGAIVASAALAPEARTMAALVAIVCLGVPHGALDGEIARHRLRPRFGAAWSLVFAIPYLGAAAVVLLGWRWAPHVTLTLFLAASVWHFGEEGHAGAGLIDVLLRGGLPIAVPMLVHPAATASVMATTSGLPAAAVSGPLHAVAVVWAVAGSLWGVRAVREPRWQEVTTVAATVLVVAVLPPLTAFALYFVCLHAPAHVGSLLRDPERAPRVVDWRSAARRAAPWTVLTIALGAALWPLYAGPAPQRLLALTIQGLAALTLPHMLLDAGLRLAARRGRAPMPAVPARAG